MKQRTSFNRLLDLHGTFVVGTAAQMRGKQRIGLLLLGQLNSRLGPKNKKKKSPYSGQAFAVMATPTLHTPWTPPTNNYSHLLLTSMKSKPNLFEDPARTVRLQMQRSSQPTRRSNAVQAAGLHGEKIDDHYSCAPHLSLLLELHGAVGNAAFTEGRPRSPANCARLPPLASFAGYGTGCLLR